MAQFLTQNNFSDALVKKVRLIVGLGNPGPKYAYTRHNAGQLALQAFLTGQGAKLSVKPQLQAQVAELNIGGQKVVCAVPTTYMNESGKALFALQNYFEAAEDQILVISDDIDLPVGTVRARLGGSSGGHNGLKSVINSIGEGFARIRIGVTQQEDSETEIDTKDYVLSRLSQTDLEVLAKLQPTVDGWINDFIEGELQPDSFTLK